MTQAQFNNLVLVELASLLPARAGEINALRAQVGDLVDDHQDRVNELLTTAPAATPVPAVAAAPAAKRGRKAKA